MSSPESDIAEGITLDKLPEHIGPPRTTFLPWHRVRKQYIRRHQWNELIKRNVKGKWRRELQRPSATAGQTQITMHVVEPLRCLVIPGDDLLDVRSLWNEINPLDCFIRYLGFNQGHGSEEQGTRLHLANNTMTSLDGVLRDSQVLRDRFEAIAGVNSQAYSYLKRYGPYHIVNLDFCGSMFPNIAKTDEPYYTALNRLLKYQFAAQKTNWLLFITTIVEPGVVDDERMQKLCTPTRDNFDDNVDFATRVETFVPRAAMQDGVKKVNLSELSGEQIICLFGIALGKWLLRLGQVASPRWTVEMRRSFRYSINKGVGAVMLSLAFDITPNFEPPLDATGISKLQIPVKAFPSERECAIKLAESVANIANVEDILTAERLRTALRDEAADLLASVGYDREKYLQWVDDGETVAEG
jgi:hypothetical protein